MRNELKNDGRYNQKYHELMQKNLPRWLVETPWFTHVSEWVFTENDDKQRDQFDEITLKLLAQKLIDHWKNDNVDAFCEQLKRAKPRHISMLLNEGGLLQIIDEWKGGSLPNQAAILKIISDKLEEAGLQLFLSRHNSFQYAESYKPLRESGKIYINLSFSGFYISVCLLAPQLIANLLKNANMDPVRLIKERELVDLLKYLHRIDSYVTLMKTVSLQHLDKEFALDDVLWRTRYHRIAANENLTTAEREALRKIVAKYDRYVRGKPIDAEWHMFYAYLSRQVAKVNGFNQAEFLLAYFNRFLLNLSPKAVGHCRQIWMLQAKLYLELGQEAATHRVYEKIQGPTHLSPADNYALARYYATQAAKDERYQGRADWHLCEAAHGGHSEAKTELAPYSDLGDLLSTYQPFYRPQVSTAKQVAVIVGVNLLSGLLRLAQLACGLTLLLIPAAIKIQKLTNHLDAIEDRAWAALKSDRCTEQDEASLAALKKNGPALFRSAAPSVSQSQKEAEEEKKKSDEEAHPFINSNGSSSSLAVTGSST